MAQPCGLRFRLRLWSGATGRARDAPVMHSRRGRSTDVQPLIGMRQTVSSLKFAIQSERKPTAMQPPPPEANVWVFHPCALRKRLKKKGPLSREAMNRIAHRLDLSLPPAAGS